MTAADADPALIAEIGRMMRELAVQKRRATALEVRLAEQRRRQDILFRAIERAGIGDDDGEAAAGTPPLRLVAVPCTEPSPGPGARRDHPGGDAVPPLRPRAGFACLGLEGTELPVLGIILPAADGDALVSTVRAVAARQVVRRDFLPVFVLDADDLGPVRRRGYSYAWIPPAPDGDPEAAADRWQARLDRLWWIWRFDRLEIGATPLGTALAARLSGASEPSP